MWSDNETATDLLGFSVHKDLIRQLVLDDNLLPITVGVFGDWGGGKSSVMRMLQRDLQSQGDVVCLYFNGWMLEGYEDAKAALITSILLQLGEHKHFGPQVRDRVVSLAKRVDFWSLAKQGSKYIPAALGVIGAATGMLGVGDSGLPISMAALIPGMTSLLSAMPKASAEGKAETEAQGDNAEEPGDDPHQQSEEGFERVDWQELLARDKTKPGPLDIRTFRRDFAKLLADTSLRSLVILVDDLDRCAPDRLIENLEAIKLFLAVPKTAFVIAADERIVRHAIGSRYAAPRLREQQPVNEEPYDLVTDYLEKLVQVPYHLPRLSPSEIESYVTLLFCQLHLAADGGFEKARAHCEEARKKNFHVTYNARMVQEALGAELPEPLARQLQWTNSIAPALTEGLKGNPRQVKRFLNALMLRKQLAEVASLDILDSVLVKLMLLEYSRPKLFDKLYEWQATTAGHSAQLKLLEDRARSEGSTQVSSTAGEAAVAEADLQGWGEKAVQGWLHLEPALGDVDLRDYFWVARDRIRSTVAGLAMVPPLVRSLFKQLISSNEGDRAVGAKGAQKLDHDELASLYQILSQHLQRHPDDQSAIDGMVELMEGSLAGALEAFLEAVGAMPAQVVEPGIPYILGRYAKPQSGSEAIILQILNNLAGTHTRAGSAAQNVLRDRHNQPKEEHLWAPLAGTAPPPEATGPD